MNLGLYDNNHMQITNAVTRVIITKQKLHNFFNVIAHIVHQNCVNLLVDHLQHALQSFKEPYFKIVLIEHHVGPCLIYNQPNNGNQSCLQN